MMPQRPRYAPKGPRKLALRKHGPFSRLLKQKGSGLWELMNQWEAIVGAEASHLCGPVRILKQSSATEGGGGTLVISATPECTVMVRHNISFILGRLSTLFPKLNIKRIKLVADFVLSRPRRGAYGALPSLSAAQEEALAAKTGVIKSAVLRRALTDLGRVLHQQGPGTL